MKDKVLNALTLLTVAAALVLTLLRGAPEPDAPSRAPAVIAVPTAAPTAAPHPAQAYRARRAEVRQQDPGHGRPGGNRIGRGGGAGREGL